MMYLLSVYFYLSILSLSRYEDGFDQLREEDTSLRLVAENLKVEISTLKHELTAKQTEFTETENSLRNEVTRNICKS